MFHLHSECLHAFTVCLTSLSEQNKTQGKATLIQQHARTALAFTMGHTRTSTV